MTSDRDRWASVGQTGSRTKSSDSTEVHTTTSGQRHVVVKVKPVLIKTKLKD